LLLLVLFYPAPNHFTVEINLTPSTVQQSPFIKTEYYGSKMSNVALQAQRPTRSRFNQWGLRSSMGRTLPVT